MTRVTLDTNILPATQLIETARGRDFTFARVTVTDREVEGTPYEVNLEGVGTLLETGVWDESRWGKAVYASEDSPLAEILGVISNGSFPSDRSNLSKGQRRQLRDAMIFEAHLRERNHIFVTNDQKAFIRCGRREAFETRFDTQILTEQEFRQQLG